MKVPKIRTINEWYEVDDYLHVDFMLDVDYHNEQFTQECARWLDIPMDDIIDYVDSHDYLIEFTDRWDYASESTYQEYYRLDIDDWLNDRLDDKFIVEYLEHVIHLNGVPDITILV